MKQLIKKLLRENLNSNIIAYHVSDKLFDEFDVNKIGSNNLHLKKEKDKFGFFFTTEKWDIDSMVNTFIRYNKKPFIYKCELFFKNPYTLEDFNSLPESKYNTSNSGWNIFDQNTDLILNDAFKLKKDAIFFNDFIVVFDSSQIKILNIKEI
jgi:hypothetical protein